MRILPSVLGAERRGGASCKSEALVLFRTADVIGTGRSYTASDPGPTRTASPDTAEPDPTRAASPAPDPAAPRRPGMYQWRKFEFFEEKAAGRGGAGAEGRPPPPCRPRSRAASPAARAAAAASRWGATTAPSGSSTAGSASPTASKPTPPPSSSSSSSRYGARRLDLIDAAVGILSPPREVVGFVDSFLVTVLVNVVYYWYMCN